MAALVITVIGDNRTGLVDALSGAIAAHDGNWEQSHMAELAGKFAGIVLVRVPDGNAAALVNELDSIESAGLLDITVELATEPGTAASPPGQRIRIELLGQDHPGIVHDVSHALAQQDADIDELETETVPAPQGGRLFKASAVVELSGSSSVDSLQQALEAVAADLMVDLSTEPL